jgi:alpha-beta hydrolase superfamily lysophospholipase
VTIVQVPGALHDVTLSPEPVRSQVYAEVQRFITAYVD